MKEKIKELCGERCEKRKLYIAGHSLGGALATVATARLIYEDKMNVAGVYTIGSPRRAAVKVARRAEDDRFRAQNATGSVDELECFRTLRSTCSVSPLKSFAYRCFPSRLVFPRARSSLSTAP